MSRHNASLSSICKHELAWDVNHELNNLQISLEVTSVIAVLSYHWLLSAACSTCKSFWHNIRSDGPESEVSL